MSEFFDVADLDWQPVRPNVTHDVFGKNLLDGKTKVVLTRIAPGGKFKPHRDNYAHMFYFSSGTGIVQVEQRKFDVYAGTVVQVNAGQMHAYENTGADDLVLISLNLPTDAH